MTPRSLNTEFGIMLEEDSTQRDTTNLPRLIQVLASDRSKLQVEKRMNLLRRDLWY